MKKQLLIGLFVFCGALNAMEGLPGNDSMGDLTERRPSLYRYITPHAYRTILGHLRAGNAQAALDYYSTVSMGDLSAIGAADMELINALNSEAEIDATVKQAFYSGLGR